MERQKALVPVHCNDGGEVETWSREGPTGTRRPEFAESDVELAETLDNLDDAAGYASWIFELFVPYLQGRVLEVGAGHGTFTELHRD